MIKPHNDCYDDKTPYVVIYKTDCNCPDLLLLRDKHLIKLFSRSRLNCAKAKEGVVVSRAPREAQSRKPPVQSLRSFICG